MVKKKIKIEKEEFEVEDELYIMFHLLRDLTKKIGENSG